MSQAEADTPDYGCHSMLNVLTRRRTSYYNASVHIKANRGRNDAYETAQAEAGY